MLVVPLPRELVHKEAAHFPVERLKRTERALDDRKQFLPIFCKEALCLGRVKVCERKVEVRVTEIERADDHALSLTAHLQEDKYLHDAPTGKQCVIFHARMA